MNKKSALIDKHKIIRREIVLELIRDSMDRENVIISEKLFNLDGTDSFNYYFHHL